MKKRVKVKNKPRKIMNKKLKSMKKTRNMKKTVKLKKIMRKKVKKNE